MNIPKPSISMPNSISNKPGFYDDPPPAASSGPNKQPNTSDEARKEQSNANKTQSQSANSNSGWFGGIWNKLSMKPKNQMILPDDKNPSIVWDSDKKKWVNTDGDVDEAEEFKPPPKMTDLATNHQQSQSVNPPITQPVSHEQYTNPNPVPTNLPPATTGFDPPNPVRSMPSTNSSTGGETTKIPNLQSNMFKMQRNRTLKKSYVDVFNPSGAPAKPIEPIMAPTVPVPSIPQRGFFVPGAVPANGDGQSQPDSSTHFYNPNQHGAGGFHQ
ncbi:Protein transport protein sec-16A.1 [Pseudolycoriella hygida]|uniref:Protein transport protein sec-16A.1 n=1 Tax=Pseudolycoriella hygida TaxID=35572 RepID=A0A9Q0MU88_9DIPT|nr:Protein transport protein sec-16A.1 [Pseudolycoriella hygida]